MSHLGFRTRRELERFLNEAEELRDLLAHGAARGRSGSSLAIDLQGVLQKLEVTPQAAPTQRRKWTM